jgi:hypothetical protein
MVSDSLSAGASRGAEAEFLVGLDGHATEPEAVWELFDLCEKYASFSLYCYARLPSALYHPKLYLLRSADEVVCSVGSSNLTAGGLSRNVEINLVLSGAVDEEPVSDLYAAYGRLKFHPDRVVPDRELLSLYEQVAKKERARDRAEQKDESTQSFVDKAKTLAKPSPGPRDLVGWLELVYDALPEGIFRNTDVYVKADEFEARYPGNANVRAKIRQQLQVLRDMGLIEHQATGIWRKL